MTYLVTFYQCGVDGLDPEYYHTKREAIIAATGFLKAFLPMPGHTYKGSVYHDGYARIVDHMGRTEALAEVHGNLLNG